MMGFYDFYDFYGIGINDGLTSEIKEGRKTRISQMELGYGWLCFPEVWPPTAKIILLDFQIKWHKDVSMISIGVSPANWHCWRPSEYGDASCQSDMSIPAFWTSRRCGAKSEICGKHRTSHCSGEEVELKQKSPWRREGLHWKRQPNVQKLQRLFEKAVAKSLDARKCWLELGNCLETTSSKRHPNHSLPSDK